MGDKKRHNGSRPVGVWEWGLLYKEARASEQVDKPICRKEKERKIKTMSIKL